jgi:hypothetical protein
VADSSLILSISRFGQERFRQTDADKNRTWVPPPLVNIAHYPNKKISAPTSLPESSHVSIRPD